MNEELYMIKAELWTKVYVHYLGTGKESRFAAAMADRACEEYSRRFEC